MNAKTVFEQVAATPPDQFAAISDERLVAAAIYAAEHDHGLIALMLGVEIGIREGARDEGAAPSLIEALTRGIA